MNTRLKFFFRAECPKCSPAKLQVAQLFFNLLLQYQDCTLEVYDMDITDGLSEGAFYSVMATPTLILFEGEAEQEQEIKRWAGDMPSLEVLQKLWN